MTSDYELLRERMAKRRLLRFVSSLLKMDIEKTSVIDVLIEQFDVNFNENGEMVILNIDEDNC